MRIPGRGGALVYALDEQGNRIPDTEKKDVPKEEPRRGRRRQRGGRRHGRDDGLDDGRRRNRKGSRKSQADIEKEQKEEAEQKKKEMAAKLVAGNDEATSTKEKRPRRTASSRQAHSNSLKRSPKDCAGWPSPAFSTMASSSPTTARRSRTRLSPIRTTPGWTSSGNPSERRLVVGLGDGRRRGEPQDPR